jgi:GntR family transcriptional regulator, rspAB operon transcriptional repressor
MTRMTTTANVHSMRASARSARAVVHEILRQRIISLEFAPGEPLSESDLAGKLGVSRTPVRESLILLAEEGLVDVVPQVGTFVSRIRESDTASAQFVREALERAALVGGGASLTEAQIHGLRGMIIDQNAAVAADDLESFFRLDDEFHAALMRATGHEAAWPIVGQAKSQLDRARRLSLSLTQQPRLLTDQHNSVVERLAARDVPGADRALRDHLRLVFHDIKTIRQEHPEMFDGDDAPVVLSRRPRS